MAWDEHASWSGEELRREAFFFPSGEDALYGSVYACPSGAPSLGIVVCGSWGYEGNQTSRIGHWVSYGLALAGGAGFCFHHPGFGDSYGDPGGATLERLAEATVDAVREARRRHPDTRWILVGPMLGASIAALAAARDAALDQLVLVQPDLRPSRHFARLERASRRSIGRPAPVPGYAYGYPLSPAVLESARAADGAVDDALAGHSGQGTIVAYEEPAELAGAPERFGRIRAPGKWRFGQEEFAELIRATSRWLRKDSGLLAAPGPSREPPVGPAVVTADRPLVLPTRVGPVGAIVSEPPGERRGALVFVQGLGTPGRAGVNANWTKLARALAAELGLLVLRFDLCSEGESTPAGDGVEHGEGWRRSTDLAILRELGPWLRERAGVDALHVAGSCHGGRVALEFAATDSHVAGLFATTPYLWAREPAKRHDESELPDPVWAGGPTFDTEEDLVEAFAACLGRFPVWLLIGGDEVDQVEGYARRLGPVGAPPLELEIAPGIPLHPVGHPLQQETVHRRLLARLARAVG